MFEDARAGRGGGEGAEAAHPVGVDHDHLARRDLPLVASADHVQRDGFAGKDDGVADPAHHQGTDAERVAAGDQALLGQHQEGIGAFDLVQRIDDPVEHLGLRRGGDEVDDDFGVGGRLEDRAAAIERAAQLHRVGDVAVVGNREAAVGKFGEQGLDVAQRAGAGGRIADVAQRGAAGERADGFVAVEVAGDMALGAVRMEAGAVERGDARRFLPAMLEGVEPERDEAGRHIGVPHAEHAAFLAQLVVIKGIGRKHGCRPSAV